MNLTMREERLQELQEELANEKRTSSTSISCRIKKKKK